MNKYNRLCFSDIIIFVAILSLFGPGHYKSYLIICSTVMLYIIMNLRYVLNINLWIYAFVVLMYTLYNIAIYGFNLTQLYLMNMYLAPFYGVSLQYIRIYKYDGFNRDFTQLYMLIIVYILYLIDGINTAKIGYWTDGNILWVFHSSLLAYIGCILALELYVVYRNIFTYMIMILLLSLPMIGALRQHVFTVVPFFAAFVLHVRFRAKFRVFIFVIPMLLFVFRDTSHYERLSSVIQKNAGSLMQYYNVSSTIADEEDTFQTRYRWWVEAVNHTINKSILFGYNLNYEYDTTTGPNAEGLHSHFVTVFASGGIMLLTPLLCMYISLFIKAIKRKDIIAILGMHAAMVVLSMNMWANITTINMILFYFYGRYAVKRKLLIKGVTIA